VYLPTCILVPTETSHPPEDTLTDLHDTSAFVVEMGTKCSISTPERGLLNLPREVRDLIHEYVLVRGVISIECAMTKTSSAQSSDYSKEISGACYSLRAPRIQRRLWSLPGFDLDQNDLDNDQYLPSTVYMTYQYARASKDGIASRSSVGSMISLASADSGLSTYRVGNGLDLKWLQVCRQVYEEASRIFYGQNIFSFTGDFRIPTAFAFLCDRPAASLRRIAALELALMEDTNMSGTSQAHYPIIRRATDSLVLQYAYHYFTELCTLLSTSRMRLRKLYLSVETMSTPRVGPDDLMYSFRTEMEDIRGQDPRPLWLDPLLNIEDLELVELYWAFRQPRLLRMSQTTALIRKHTLVETPRNFPVDGMTTTKLHDTPLEFRALQLPQDGPDIVSGGTRKWRYYSLHGEELKLLRREEENVPMTANQYSSLPKHLDWAFELYRDMWLFHCTLRHV
jgi:hypothetical protein